MLNCCVDLETIKARGITAPQFVCLARCQGLNVTLSLAQESTVENFRKAVRFACVEGEIVDEVAGLEKTSLPEPPPTILVASYDRRTLGQTGSGHFSPIAAYDEVSDSVLILDTARFKYGAHWVPLTLLFEAMQPIDPDTGRSRGFALLTTSALPLRTDDSYYHGRTHATTADERTPSIGQAVLLWSPMDQREARRKFKRHMQQKQELRKMESDRTEVNASALFHDIWEYCSVNGTNYNHVWNLTQIQLQPTTDDLSSEALRQRLLLVNRMQSILDGLVRLYLTSEIEGIMASKSTTSQALWTIASGEAWSVKCQLACRPNCARTLPVTPLQVIGVLYLAMVENTHRSELLLQPLNDKGRQDQVDAMELDQLAREQLAVEAHLLRTAIDVSDDDDTVGMLLS